jgi:phenylacetic acid degradation operon negative regulatory protein
MSTAPDQPPLSRRAAAGAAGARGLLFSVLGEFVLPGGGAVWTSTIIDVLGRLGVEEKASRQALMRTAADGWLRSERVGRRTRWWLTDAASNLLTEGTARIFGFTGGVSDWDGQWLLVLARVPETDRPARHRLRTRLAWAGLGSPSPGVWLSTRTDRLAEARQVLADAGMLDDAQLFLARYAGGGPLERLVRESWDLSAIEADYERFLDGFGDEFDAGFSDGSDAGFSDGSDAGFSAELSGDPLACIIELVHAWRRFPRIDPGLPRELLPTPWSGESAAGLFIRRHEQWASGARDEWRRIDM